MLPRAWTALYLHSWAQGSRLAFCPVPLGFGIHVLCLPWESTALLHGRVFWGGYSVFCFAAVLFQLIKPSLLQNANGNYEAKGALLQELSEFFVLNEAVSAGAFGKTFLSRVLYNLVALALSWELNAFFGWFLSGLLWFNVRFLVTVLSIPWKWESLEHSWCSTSRKKCLNIHWEWRASEWKWSSGLVDGCLSLKWYIYVCSVFLFVPEGQC